MKNQKFPPSDRKYVAFVGAGSANMFAVLRIIDSGFDPSQILLIDRGKSPCDRCRSGRDIVEGFAGAGLWSDGKMVYSEHDDASIVSLEDKQKYHPIIREMVDRFGVGYETVTKPVDFDPETLGIGYSMKLLQSTVYHLGTDRNVELGKRMFDFIIKSGVNVLMETEVVSLAKGDDGVVMISCKRLGTQSYECQYIQWGTGKVGVKQFNELCSYYGVKKGSGSANVGFRFEMMMNDKVKNIVHNYQYDFKFSKGYRFQMDGYYFYVDVRTFCVNNGAAYVIEEPAYIEGVEYKTYNGHGYGLDNPEKNNGRTNFGVIARIRSNHPNFDANRVHSEYIKAFFDAPVYHGSAFDKDVMLGGKIRTSIGISSNDRFIVDILCDVSYFIDDFMIEIEKILGISEYRAHFPEIKLAGGIVETCRGFVDYNRVLPNVSWVGDCCTGVVGIVPSAVTGLMAVDAFIEKNRHILFGRC